MKSIICITLAIICFISSLQARLGESFDQCQKRYAAKGMKKVSETSYHVKLSDQVLLELNFEDGKCEIICYYATGDLDELSKEQQKIIVETNTGKSIADFELDESDDKFNVFTHAGYILILPIKKNNSITLSTDKFFKSLDDKEKAKTEKSLDGI